MNDSREAQIPVLSVTGQNIPEAWEKAVLAVCGQGTEVRTEYDQADDPPSFDATGMVEVREPLGEPRIHKNFPGGPRDLEVYRQEVLHGIHDHWINPSEGKWTYTYHQRLFAYGAGPPDEGANGVVDQMEGMLDKLCEAPHTRRAQAVTWIPKYDPATDDPPCLQRLWARLLPGEESWVLNLNSHWRSRDLYKAWFMNAFALTDVQRWMVEQLQERLSEPVTCGRYMDISDSLHVYGSYRTEDLDEELEKMQSSSYRERAWESSVMEPMFREVRENLREDPDYYS